MNEVDTTLIPILKDVGCKLNNDINGIDQFGPDEITSACSHILFAINNNIKLPIKLPTGSAARVRLTSKLANTIQSELGYTGELGYQHFLYPNEKDMRRLLIFLVDKLPKTEESGGQEVVGVDSGFSMQLRKSISNWSQKKWSPYHSLYDKPNYSFNSRILEMPNNNSANNNSLTKYYSDYQPLSSTQANDQVCFVSSLIEYNTLEVANNRISEKEWADNDSNKEKKDMNRRNLIAESFRIISNSINSTNKNNQSNQIIEDMLNTYTHKSTLLSRRTDFQQEKDDIQVQVVDEGKVSNITETGDKVEEDEDARRARQEAELAELKSKIQQIRDAVTDWEHMSTAAVNEAHHIKGELASVTEETKTLESAYKVKKRTLDLLPDAESNLKKLQEIANVSAQRLVKLAKEWEVHRAPLIAKYRRKKQEIEDRKHEARNKLEQIKMMRNEMKIMADETREKDMQHRQVLEEYNRLPKSINRQVYVQRIMDIVKNLERQKVDIHKVLIDVRQVQKDINSVGETNKRSFALTDEMIFQYASQTNKNGRKDPEITKSYKHLVNLRKGFDTLVETVEVMGKTKNEIRDLTSRIEALEARNVSANMERIKKDLNEVQKENKQLTEQLTKIMK